MVYDLWYTNASMTNKSCIGSVMEKLYCAHCKKTYDVAPASIRLMQENGKSVPKKGETYRFESGCFFKELAALKRKEPAR